MGDTISYPLPREDREAVRMMCDHFCTIFPSAEFGPAHIMLGDYNLLDHNLDFSQKQVYKAIAGIDHGFAELHATLALIAFMRCIPTDLRDIHDWAEEFEE